MKRLMRALALLCLLASLPVSMIKYPWLPATAHEYVTLQLLQPSDGTPSYREGRERELVRTRYALLLYALGAGAQLGLLAIVLRRGSPRVHVCAWALTAVTGAGVAAFCTENVGPETRAAFVISTVHLPLAASLAATVGAVATLVAEGVAWRARTVSRDGGLPPAPSS